MIALIFLLLLSLIRGTDQFSLPYDGGCTLCSNVGMKKMQSYGFYLSMSTFENAALPEISESPPPLPNLERRRPLKVALLATAARTCRGEIATPQEKNVAKDIIEKLESLNPIENPASSDYSLGKWELVYSNTNLFRSSPFFMAGRAQCKDGQEADTFNTFCDLHRQVIHRQDFT
jgi:hypothetical protein